MAARAIFLEEPSQLKVKSTLILYGKYAHSELGEKIIAEINRMWNEPQASIELQGKLYDIIFDIDFRCVSSDEVIKLVLDNKDYELNFIRIEDNNIAERSLMGFGLGENSGHWLITDQLGDSTTAAHEFGHALGLPHPEEQDFRNSGNPPIMAPRGTWVDSEFQWNPLAEVGAFGGTMRPIFRKVRAHEVLEVLRDINPESLEPINIGKLTNQLFDEIGRPASILKDFNI